MTTQALLWTGSGAAMALAVTATLAERRRAARRNLDRPGWVPWAPIQILAAIAAIAAAALALKG
jgi:hypothetical protein